MKSLPGLLGARPRTRLRLLAATVVALSPAVLTVSCLPGKVDSSCPDVFIVQDLGTISRYGAGGNREPGNLQFTAEMRDIKGDCSVKPGDADVRMSFSILGERGGNDRSGPDGTPLSSVDLVYFAAITDPASTILWKQEFTTTLDFGGNRRAATLEELDPHIPLPKNATAAGYKVLLGFQLTPQEVADNRKQRSAEVPAPARTPPTQPPPPAPPPPAAKPPAAKPATPPIRRPPPPVPRRPAPAPEPSAPRPAQTPYVPSTPYLETPPSQPAAPAAPVPYSGMLEPGYVAPNRPAPPPAPNSSQ